MSTNGPNPLAGSSCPVPDSINGEPWQVSLPGAGASAHSVKSAGVCKSVKRLGSETPKVPSVLISSALPAC